MKIALLAPPYLPVPPKGYGGTEKIVALLADGLVDRGHDVTLFASGDSHTKANLASIYPHAIGNSGLTKGDPLLPLLHYKSCFDRAGEFDIIHSHAQYLGLFASQGTKTPVVHTWHGSFYEGEVPESKRQELAAFRRANIISISNNQRGGMPDLHYIATIYNSINLDQYSFNPSPKGGPASPKGGYLLWVGRITEKKGPRVAIDVAKATGLPLKMAAAIDPVDQPYFEKEIQPFIDGKKIELLGELDHQAVVSLYGNALCTLFPITWHEPFGLVMIESMACGTPVVAYNMGAVPEVVADGKTGFIINTTNTTNSNIQKRGVDGLVEAVKRIGEIDRAACRNDVEKRFSAPRMLADYERVYGELI